MTILSDDLVEKAARAMYEARWSVTLRGDSEHGPEDTRNARAALEAALPGIVEERDGFRRERDVLLELVKGSPEVMSAYEMLKKCNRVNIWWGPEGTPQTVAAEVAKALEQIGAGDFDEVPDEPPLSSAEVRAITEEAVRIVEATDAAIRNLSTSTKGESDGR